LGEEEEEEEEEGEEGGKELDFSCSSSAHCRTTTTAVSRIVVKTPAEKLDRVAV